MADIFSRNAALSLLTNKFILLIGDSNIRALYNDLIYLLHNNDVVPPIVLRKHSNKGIGTSLDLDRVVRKGQVTDATRHIQEVREYLGEAGVRVRFCFVTRVLGDQMLRELQEMEQGNGPLPDIVVMHSCLWDITRWGAMQEAPYKRFMTRAFLRLRALLPADALLVWATAMPVALSQVKGGYLIKQLEFIQCNVRFMALEANLYAAELCKLFGFDLLDFHYHMRFQLARRSSDGIHWEPHAMRHLTCILLTHIALSFDHPLPGLLPSAYLSSAVEAAKEHSDLNYQTEVRLGPSMVSAVLRELEAASEGRPPPYDVDPDQERRKKRGRRFNLSSPNKTSSGSGSNTFSRPDDSRRRGAVKVEQGSRHSSLARLDTFGYGERKEPSSDFHVRNDGGPSDDPRHRRLEGSDGRLYPGRNRSHSPVRGSRETSQDGSRDHPLSPNRAWKRGMTDREDSKSTESLVSLRDREPPLLPTKSSSCHRQVSAGNVSDHRSSSPLYLDQQPGILVKKNSSPPSVLQMSLAESGTRTANAAPLHQFQNSGNSTRPNDPETSFNFGSRIGNLNVESNNARNWMGSQQPTAPRPLFNKPSPFMFENTVPSQLHLGPLQLRLGSGQPNACNPFNNPPGFVGQPQLLNSQQVFLGSQATPTFFTRPPGVGYVQNSQPPWLAQPPQPRYSRPAYPNTDCSGQSADYFASDHCSGQSANYFASGRWGTDRESEMASGLAAVALHLQTKSYGAQWSGVPQPSYPRTVDLNQLLTSAAQARQNWVDPKTMNQFSSGYSGGYECYFHAGVNDSSKNVPKKTRKRNKNKKANMHVSQRNLIRR